MDLRRERKRSLYKIREQQEAELERIRRGMGDIIIEFS
jgi:hypothetical protein